jgi:hypothetical protein
MSEIDFRPKRDLSLLRFQALIKILEEARSANDEKAAYRLLQALKSASEEHRRQADSLLTAEGRIILLEKIEES